MVSLEISSFSSNNSGFAKMLTFLNFSWIIYKNLECRHFEENKDFKQFPLQIYSKVGRFKQRLWR